MALYDFGLQHVVHKIEGRFLYVASALQMYFLHILVASFITSSDKIKIIAQKLNMPMMTELTNVVLPAYESILKGHTLIFVVIFSASC